MTIDTAARPALNGQTEAAPRGAWLGRAAQLLCLLFAVFVIFGDVQEVLWRAGLQPDAGSLGARFDITRADAGSVPVLRVAPGGAMAEAGVVAGDKVGFDRPYDAFRRFRTGEAAGFTLVHAARTSHLQVQAQAAKPVQITGPTVISLIFFIATGMSALIGGFIVWRSRGQATTLLLGMALVAYGSDAVMPQLLLSAPQVYPFALALNVASFVLVPVLFYAFAMRFYGDCVAPAAAWEKGVFWIYAVAMLSLGALQLVSALAMSAIGDVLQAMKYASYPGFAACLAYMVQGWRRSTAMVQQRYALMLVATSAIMLAAALDILTAQSQSDAVNAAHYLANSILTGVIGSGLFAYAILRRKVFDLGFAVNRTLVYAVVSAILLAAFGLIEWAVDHFVTIEGRENNALVDAGIAVGVYLTFHRVRDVVEHAVEGLFFRRWQKAEAALRRFAKEAAFITSSAALTTAFARALGQFGEGAQAAVYLLDGRGYARAAGQIDGVADRLEADLPALVSLRADPKPEDIHDGDLAADVVAPMVNRNEVIGLVLIGPKPSGLSWRPDEIELIGWATRQVGLDLHALKVEQLEAVAAEQREEMARINARNQELRLALGVPTSA